MLLGALAEGFGLLMIVPIATIAISGSAGPVSHYLPWLTGWPADQRLIAALSLFLAAMAARALLLFARDRLLAKLTADYEASLRLRSAATLGGRGWPFASGVGQAGMQSLLLNDVPRAAEAASLAGQMGVGASMLLVQLALTLLLSPGLTLVAVLFLAAGWLSSLRFTRRGVESGLAIADAMEDSAGSGFRLHAGLKAALAQGTLPSFLGEYRSSLDCTAAQFTRFATDYGFARQAAAFGAALVAAVLLLVGVRVLALPFPVLAASLILFARMSGPAQILQSSAVRFSAYAPSFGAIERRLGPLKGSVPPELRHPPLDWERLRLSDASFEHQPGLGLSAACLELRNGQWLGISGVSGAGKTTLIDLVAGLLQPREGRIAVDDRALEGETLERWRAGLAYVGQEGNVFNDSVRGNLLAEGVAAGEAELWRALDLVGLAERVRAFRRGLDESVGDRGSQLSGGERQRLVLARALLRSPGLLILDEATSALDPEGEATVLERIKAIEPRPAALIVAHRDSTLRHCDSVLAIQHRFTAGSGGAAS
jgi:ABC-type multidrug transport system fused ATPase/permease subunit